MTAPFITRPATTNTNSVLPSERFLYTMQRECRNYIKALSDNGNFAQFTGSIVNLRVQARLKDIATYAQETLQQLYRRVHTPQSAVEALITLTDQNAGVKGLIDQLAAATDRIPVALSLKEQIVTLSTAYQSTHDRIAAEARRFQSPPPPLPAVPPAATESSDIFAVAKRIRAFLLGSHQGCVLPTTYFFNNQRDLAYSQRSRHSAMQVEKNLYGSVLRASDTIASAVQNIRITLFSEDPHHPYAELRTNTKFRALVGDLQRAAAGMKLIFDNAAEQNAGGRLAAQVCNEFGTQPNYQAHIKELQSTVLERYRETLLQRSIRNLFIDCGRHANKATGLNIDPLKVKDHMDHIASLHKHRCREMIIEDTHSDPSQRQRDRINLIDKIRDYLNRSNLTSRRFQDHLFKELLGGLNEFQITDETIVNAFNHEAQMKVAQVIAESTREPVRTPPLWKILASGFVEKCVPKWIRSLTVRMIDNFGLRAKVLYYMDPVYRRSLARQ